LSRIARHVTDDIRLPGVEYASPICRLNHGALAPRFGTYLPAIFLLLARTVDYGSPKLIKAIANLDRIHVRTKRPPVMHRYHYGRSAAGVAEYGRFEKHGRFHGFAKHFRLKFLFKECVDLRYFLAF